MSKEMKYEAVFGDQDLFYGVSCAAIIVIKSNGTGRYTITENECSDIIKLNVCQPDIEIAMRRIIREPKRWTAEDQKVGRLPDVGAELLHESEGYVNFVGEFDFRWMLRTKEGGLYLAEKFYCSPIETQEEKAERLEDEFVNELMKDGKVIYTSSEQLAMCRKTARAAYRKLSGALSVPAKGGE